MDRKELERRYGKGIAAHQAGRLNEAEAIYMQLLKEVPEADSVLTNMAALQYAKGNHVSALSFVDRALKTNPQNIDALANRANILLALERAEDARQAFSQLLSLDSSHALSNYNYGNLLYSMKDLIGAEQHFRKAFALNPGMHQAAFNLGNLLAETGRQSEARSFYEMALLQHPSHAGCQVNLANVLLELGELEEALVQTGLGIELLPKNAELLRIRSRIFNERGQSYEAFEAADLSLELEPDSADGHILLGNALSELDRGEEAIRAYRRAIELSPGHKGAERNLRRLLSDRVPAWHFPMLADKARNIAFEKAINAAVRPGDIVLDIGTGSGLLAMMAARAGAAKVVACEANEHVADIASDIVARNGYSNQVEVVSLHSAQLRVGRDLPSPVDLVVCEILDAALLGEGVLPSLRSALRHLAKPGARVVPAAATAYVQLAYLPERITSKALEDICGFDLSAFDQFRMDGEYLVVNLGERRDYACSDVLPLRRFDFQVINPARGEERPERWLQAFTVTRSGTVNALVMWFELELDEETRLSSGPGGELKHWNQAVFYMSSPAEVEAGSILNVACALSDTMWQFEIAH